MVSDRERKMKMKNKQNKSEISGIAKLYGKTLEKLRKPLWRHVKDEVRRPWNGAVWITVADLAKAKLSGNGEVKPKFVPLAEVMTGKYGNPAPVEFFCCLIAAYEPCSAFALMVTGENKKIANVFLVEKP